MTLEPAPYKRNAFLLCADRYEFALEVSDGHGGRRWERLSYPFHVGLIQKGRRPQVYRPIGQRLPAGYHDAAMKYLKAAYAEKFQRANTKAYPPQPLRT